MKRKVFIAQAIMLLIAFFPIAQGEKSALAGFSKEHIEFTGALSVRIHSEEGKLHPSGELLLIDPQGRKTGYDLKINKVLAQIPHSSYESESIDDDVSGTQGPETKIIDIRNPIDGKYTLLVIGRETGKYDLEIRGYDCRMNPSDVNFRKVKISQDVEHKYLIKYSNRKDRIFVNDFSDSKISVQIKAMDLSRINGRFIGFPYFSLLP